MWMNEYPEQRYKRRLELRAIPLSAELGTTYLDVLDITSFLRCSSTKAYGNPSGVLVYSKDKSQTIILERDRVR